MTTARKNLVDLDVTPYYHCILRSVRKAFLCGEGYEHRKQWLEDRLELLANNFSVAVAGFSIMDNHLHILCKLESEASKDWSAKEVVRRWIAVYPPATLDRDDPKTVQMWINRHAQDEEQVLIYR